MILQTLATGIGIGKACILEKDNQTHFDCITDNYKILCEKTLEKLNAIQTKDNESIIQFQTMILKDEVLRKNIESLQQSLSLSDAIKKAFNTYIEMLNSSSDAYLNQRTSDIEDILNRLLKVLHEKVSIQIQEPIILCVDTLYPSYFFEYAGFIQGVLTKKALPLSHAVILAKEKHIPILVVDEFKNENEMLLIDGDNGTISVNPSKAMISSCTKPSLDLEISHKPCKLMINYSGKEPIDGVIAQSVDGIGLYRSEFLYYENNDFPSLETQVNIYEQLLNNFKGKPVVIRTYDFGEDKNPANLKHATRGVSDYILHYEKAFLTQLTALLAVNEMHDNLEILIPMVKSYHDIEMIKNIAQGLKDKIGFQKKLPRVGAMIETKEAYLDLDSFKKVDFISIGTNDLGTSLFNFHRDTALDKKEVLDYMKEPIHVITSFAKENHIPCTICGDIAANPESLEALIKQGEKSFSIPIPFITDAKKIIFNQFK